MQLGEIVLIQEAEHFLDGAVSAGPVVFVPLVMLVTALFFRLGFMKSFRSAVTVGAGFISVHLTLGIVWNTLGPVTQTVVRELGLTLDVLDVSWPAAAGIAFTSGIGALIIPLILGANVLLLRMGLTKTANTDIWNYWHYAISGVLAWCITGSLVLGFLESVLHAAISLKLADLTAPRVQRELGIPGVSIPQGISVAFTPLILLLDRLYEKLPFLSVDGEQKDPSDNRYFRFFSEPVVMGFLIGGILGLVAGETPVGAAVVAVNLAALLLILPRSVKLIMEGLIPISQATKRYTDKHFSGPRYNIGLDSTVTLGHPATQAAGTILIPITMVLAFLLPGNRVIPVGDLVSISFFVALAAPLHRGSLRRTVLTGTVIMAIMLLISSYFAPFYSRIAMSAGSMVPAGLPLVSTLAIGNPIAWLLCLLLGRGPVGVVLALCLTAATVAVCRHFEKKNEDQ